MPATLIPGGGVKLTDAIGPGPAIGVHGSTLQSAGQVSSFDVLPSSHVSPQAACTVLLPQTHGSVDVVVLVVEIDVLVVLVELDEVLLVFEVLVVLVELVLVDEVLVELELVLVLVVLERIAQASGAGASFRFVSPPWFFTRCRRSARSSASSPCPG
jgi:hypothetical protein